MTDITPILRALRPGVDFSNPDNTLAHVAWAAGVTPPSQLEFDLAVAKGAKGAALAATYAAKMDAGVAFQGNAYDIDEVSQLRIAARALYARACIDGSAQWDASVGSWVTKGNTRATLSAQEFWSMAVAAQAAVSVNVLNARALKDAITAAASLEAVAAINVSEGWAS